MKKLILVNTLLISLACNAYARGYSMYHSQLPTHPDAISKVQTITNYPVTLNPAIDEISTSDPRIKSVIDYARVHGRGVSIVFFNIDNLRYVKKVNALFKQNLIPTEEPQLAKTQNSVDDNLIEIYVIKESNNVNTTI